MFCPIAVAESRAVKKNTKTFDEVIELFIFSKIRRMVDELEGGEHNGRKSYTINRARLLCDLTGWVLGCFEPVSVLLRFQLFY